MKASIVLATYNERNNVVRLIKSLMKECSANKIDCEIIVVDDNSPDGTADVVRKEFSKNKNVKLIVRKNERGLGSAAGRGASEASGEIVVFMDCDFSHNPKDVPRLIKLTRDYEIVNGSRHMKGGGIESTPIRKLASLAGKLAGRLYIGLILGIYITDYTNGFFAVRKEILDKLDYSKIFYGYGDYYFRLFYYAVRRGAEIKEVPVFYKFREDGESKTNFLKHGFGYALAGFRLIFKDSSNLNKL